MIGAVNISRYRGIRDLTIDGFGRVNLIIGKNDCGKTAVMEALRIAEDPDNAANLLLEVQKDRLRRTSRLRPFDFNRFWRPLFFNLDDKRGLEISTTGTGDFASNKVEVRLGKVPNDVITSHVDAHSISFDPGDLGDPADRRSWSLDLHVTRGAAPSDLKQIICTQRTLQMPTSLGRPPSVWMNSAAGTSMTEVRYISELKQRGQDHQLVDLLRSIDERMAGIELLAPGGDVPELFVRMERTAPLLPLASMGEGFQRCLELAAAAMVHDWPVIFVDEIENGMHHLALGPLWRWIATTALERGIQVFATTHSEECITAAHRAFDDLGDDGLRVIRLDRLEQRTQAAIYDRSLIETAERTGTEIRG